MLFRSLARQRVHQVEVEGVEGARGLFHRGAGLRARKMKTGDKKGRRDIKSSSRKATKGYKGPGK